MLLNFPTTTIMENGDDDDDDDDVVIITDDDEAAAAEPHDITQELDALVLDTTVNDLDDNTQPNEGATAVATFAERHGKRKGRHTIHKKSKGNGKGDPAVEKPGKGKGKGEQVV